MKKYLLVVSIGLLTLVSFLVGCARPITLSGVVTRDFNIADFNNIEVGYTNEFLVMGSTVDIPFELEVTRADAYKVSVTANENIFDFINLDKSGKTLSIIIDRKQIGTDKATLQARISLPELSGLKLTGGILSVRGFNSTQDFKVEVSGASSLDLDMQTGNTTYDISSSSHVIARGSTHNLTAKVSGAGTLDINMPTGDTTLDISSSGHVTSRGTAGRFSAEVSGAGILDMDTQTDDVTFNLSSSSRVTGHLKALDLKIDASGASRMELDGSGRDLLLTASSSSNVSMPNFTFNNAGIKLSGASKGDINVNGKIDIDLSSSSSLVYSGNPILGNVQINGASHLTHK
jgi:hypothetical protein